MVLTAAAQTATVPGGSPPAGTYRIAGTVISKTDAHPLGNARVTIRDAKDPQKFLSLLTAEDGKFAFPNLPAGKYSLNGAKRGYISAAYDQHDQFSTAIVTGASCETETLLFRLAPAGIISGRVIDEAGEPVRHAMVWVYYNDHSAGVDQIHVHRTAQTNDEGGYEITPLMPGTYYLSVSARPWYALHPQTDEPRHRTRNQPAQTTSAFDQSLDVAYPTLYYTDATDAESATPIVIRGGDRLEVDMHVNPVPALRLLFRVPADGTNTFTFPQLQQPAFDGDTNIQTDGVRRVAPGMMELTGIPAGRYDIRLFGGGLQTQMNGVDLTRNNEVIDTSASEALSSVKVSVQVPGDSTPLNQFRVGLRSGHRNLANWKPLNEKGEAQIEQLPTGKYEVEVWGPPKPYSITRMTAEGATVAGHAITITAGSAPSLHLTLAGGSFQIDGTAKRAGKALAGAMIVLVPKNPELTGDLFRRDQSDLDGTFTLLNVAPGSYTLLAIENGWDLDWSKRDVISNYLGQGNKIEVGTPGARLTGQEIEVQPK